MTKKALGIVLSTNIRRLSLVYKPRPRLISELETQGTPFCRHLTLLDNLCARWVWHHCLFSSEEYSLSEWRIFIFLNEIMLCIRTELVSVVVSGWVFGFLDSSTTHPPPSDLLLRNGAWCLGLGCKWHHDFCMVLDHLHWGDFLFSKIKPLFKYLCGKTHVAGMKPLINC